MRLRWAQWMTWLPLVALVACGRTQLDVPRGTEGGGPAGSEGEPSDGGRNDAGGNAGAGGNAVGGNSGAAGAADGGAGKGGGGCGALGATPGPGGASAPTGGAGAFECGLLIDDVERGTGRICEGLEGRRGVWYAFNDESDGAAQWPELTPPGVPIPPAELPGECGATEYAMHTFGDGFSSWGAGIGFDLAFDGVNYGLYDASAYAGITFRARGSMKNPLQLRVSTEKSTLAEHGGACEREPCYPGFVNVFFGDAWQRHWVPFDQLRDVPFERDKLTNVQFYVRNGAFDFWVDDVAFFAGEPDCCPASCQGGIRYADPTLEAAVRVSCSRPNGDLTCADVCTARSLKASGVSDLSGLECSPNLTSLDLSAGKLTNLEALSQLSSLAFLNLFGNQIEDIRPLQGLRELRGLTLTQNAVTDLRPLSGLPFLETLDVRNNRLSAIVAPFDVPSLTALTLSSNQISDLSGLSGAPALTRLNVAGNELESLEILPELPSLSSLDVMSNRLEDLGPVLRLERLTTLWASHNHLTTLSPLAMHPALESLYAAGNELGDIGTLSGSAKLRYLELSHNQIENIENLSDLDLEYFSLAGNPIRRFGTLKGVFTNRFENTMLLATFDLSDTGLTDLTDLANAEGLIHNMTLSLRNNAIDCVVEAENIAKLRARVANLDICR